MDAIDPAQADECLVDPAAPQEVVAIDWTNSAFFTGITIAVVALMLGVSNMAANPDQGVGDSGTPQVVLGANPFVDTTPDVGPPAF